MSTQSDIDASKLWFVGEDKGLVFTITDQNTGLPEDITSFTLEWELASTQYGAAILTLVAPSIVKTNPTAGVCQVNVAQSQTINLTPGTYYYTLRKINVGSASELAFGSVALLDTWTGYP